MGNGLVNGRVRIILIEIGSKRIVVVNWEKVDPLIVIETENEILSINGREAVNSIIVVQNHSKVDGNQIDYESVVGFVVVSQKHPKLNPFSPRNQEKGNFWVMS